MTYRGRCLCERVRFEVEAGDPLPFGHCHCSTCRRSHGADRTSAVIVRKDALRITVGEHHLTTYTSSPTMQRLFCTHCGSRLFVRFAADAQAFAAGDVRYTVSINCLDEVPRWQEIGHIFVEDKAPWHELDLEPVASDGD